MLAVLLPPPAIVYTIDYTIDSAIDSTTVQSIEQLLAQRSGTFYTNSVVQMYSESGEWLAELPAGTPVRTTGRVSVRWNLNEVDAQGYGRGWIDASSIGLNPPR